MRSRQRPRKVAIVSLKAPDLLVNQGGRTRFPPADYNKNAFELNFHYPGVALLRGSCGYGRGAFMYRSIFGMVLLTGLGLTACERANAQQQGSASPDTTNSANVGSSEHRGWPVEGALHSTPAQQGAAADQTAPATGSAEHRGWPTEGTLHWTPGQQSVPGGGQPASEGPAAHNGWPADGALHWTPGGQGITADRATPNNPVDWRYVYHGNRWWYWMPGNKWVFWDNGHWQDYASSEQAAR